MSYDVAVVGAGPGGSACATVCAQAGLRVAIVERSIFPREKVCGDCLNPACWPVFEKLGVAEQIRALPHACLETVEFVGTDQRVRRVSLRQNGYGEIAVKRSALDALLLRHAEKLGVIKHEGAAVTAVQWVNKTWRLRVNETSIEARTLIAADGRNSTIARLLGLLPPAKKDRVGLQTHLRRSGWEQRVSMRLLPFGYCGVADVGDGEINLCLVARPRDLDRLKQWAEKEFSVSTDQAWRTIAPLERAPIAPRHGRLLFVGDAARVVEPFTGEGIYYALASGVCAAEAIAADRLGDYSMRHHELYRGRLWINQLARQAVLHPQIASFALRLFPGMLRQLTAKIAGGSAEKVR